MPVSESSARPRARNRVQRIARISLPAVCLLPLFTLVVFFFRDELGADPIEKITHTTGDWALRFLLITLCVTPLRKYLGWQWLAPHRRLLGLTSFGYAFLHLSTYLVFDLGFDFGFLGEDILERPYITVGFATFLVLLALAVTSNRRSIRWLKKKWVTLHRLVYLAGVGGVIHFLWLVKADLREPLLYAALLAALLAARLPWQKWSAALTRP